MKKALSAMIVLFSFLLLVPVFTQSVLADSSDTFDISKGNVSIMSPGNYTITGSSDINHILVLSSGAINITLSGVSISSEKGTEPLRINSESAKVKLILAEGTENTITADNACSIDSSGKLEISGGGSLTLNGKLYTKNDLSINGSGNLNISSRTTIGVQSSGGNVSISNGNTSINVDTPAMETYTTLGDGTKKTSFLSNSVGISCNRGKVKVSGGQLNISVKAVTDETGISAYGVEISEKAKINIDAAHNSVTSAGIRCVGYLQDRIMIFDGLYISGGEIRINSANMGIVTQACKISGGDLQISSEADGIWATDCNISRGTISIKSTGKAATGIKASTLSVSNTADIKIDVPGADSKGIDAYKHGDKNVTISGGTLQVSSGCYGIYSSSNISISGGAVTSAAYGDGSTNIVSGIYSDIGTIDISGGTITAKAESSSSGSASEITGIRSYNGMNITAGTIMASGSTSALKDKTGKPRISLCSVFAGDSKAAALVVSVYNGEKYVRVSNDLSWNNPFTDVLSSDWFVGNVEYVSTRGLLSETSSATFSPYQTVSRGMIATIFWRIADKPEPTGKLALKDVESRAYYAKSAKWAAENKLIDASSDGAFEPEKCPTRGELVLILYKYAKFQGKDVTGTADLGRFSDSEKLSADEKSAMQWAVYKGLVNGSGNALAPSGLVNRAQYAAILERYLKSY